MFATKAAIDSKIVATKAAVNLIHLQFNTIRFNNRLDFTNEASSCH